MDSIIETTHKLQFEVAQWTPGEDIAKVLNTGEDGGWKLFRIGTCEGQWRATDDNYEILSVINSMPGNGHLDDVFEWFEHSCKRDNRSLKILSIWNTKFKQNLIDKRGFSPSGEENVIKHFKKES